jgi:hypothetical protein
VLLSSGPGELVLLNNSQLKMISSSVNFSFNRSLPRCGPSSFTLPDTSALSILCHTVG